MAKTLNRPARPVRAPQTQPRLTPEGLVTAIVAVTGVEDLVEDIIVPGAFAATLKKRRAKVVHHHDWVKDRGRILYAEELLPGDKRLPTKTPSGAPWPPEAGALLVTMQYNLATQDGRDAWEMVRFYAESGEAAFSIGYKVPPGLSAKRNGVRYIYGLDLWEVSAVLHGAHPLTMALEVKDAGASDLERKDTVGLAIAAPQPDFTGGVMVALYPPAAVAEQLAVDGGMPVEELHVTLAYLGDGTDWTEEASAKVADALADAVARTGPLAGSVGGLGQFPDSGNGVPTFVPVDVPGLVELRQTIVDTLAAVGYPQRSEHGFTPHLTLGYGLDGVAPVESTPVTFDDAVLVIGEDRHQLPLLTSPDLTDPVAVPTVEPERAPMEAKSALAVLAAAKPPAPPRAGWASKSAGDVALAARFGDPFGLLETKSGVPGVADTPSDQQAVARLRRAWTHGSVAAQIGWNTPGDWTRCVAIAGKYMTPEHAKGWCNLRHKDATGTYPGDASNVGLQTKTATPELETKMAKMAGSMQEHLEAVGAAVRKALGGDDGDQYVCIDATYADHVIATRMKNGSEESFSMTYAAAGENITVGDPTPVTLSVIAAPSGEGVGEELSVAAAVEARFVEPTIGSLEELSAVVAAAPLEAKSLRALRPAIQEFLDSLALKGMDVPGLLLGDDEEDDDDDADEDDEKPEGEDSSSGKPWEKKGTPAEDDLEDTATDEDTELDEDDDEDDLPPSDEDKDEDPEEKGLIALDFAAVYAELATLNSDD